MGKTYNYTSRYSLADYQVTLTIPTIGNLTGEEISIGGPGEDNKGSCVGEIKVTRNENIWTTEGDPTGSWVHNKNLNKTGTVEINIRQVSAVIYKLMEVCQAYETVSSRGSEGITITVNPAGNFGIPVIDFITCKDCFIQKIPDQDYTDTAKEQQWIFTCGQISFPTSAY